MTPDVIKELPTWQGILNTPMAEKKLTRRKSGTYLIYDHSTTQQTGSSFVFYIGLMDGQNKFQEICCLYSMDKQNFSTSINSQKGSLFIRNDSVEELLEAIAASFSVILIPYFNSKKELTYEEFRALLFKEERLNRKTESLVTSKGMGKLEQTSIHSKQKQSNNDFPEPGFSLYSLLHPLVWTHPESVKESSQNSQGASIEKHSQRTDEHSRQTVCNQEQTLEKQPLNGQYQSTCSKFKITPPRLRK